MRVQIECNIINFRKRYLCIYPNDKLCDYFISAVPLCIEDERADKLIAYIEKYKSKLNDKELRQFNRKIKYMKKVNISE